MLSTQGFEVFLPLYTAVRQWRDRVGEVSLPLFPCYVFLRGGLDRRHQVVITPGIHSILETAGRPAVIPTAEIEAIRQTTQRSLRLEPHPFLKSGDRVRVKSGPLEGIEGVLIRKKNTYRLILSVDLLQRSAAVEVNAAIVERVNEQIPQPLDRPKYKFGRRVGA